MQISYTRKFVKMYAKAPKKIQQAFHAKRSLFMSDPFSPALNNHILSGRLKSFRSINITGDWRVIFSTDKKHSQVIFHLLGKHSQLYK